MLLDISVSWSLNCLYIGRGWMVVVVVVVVGDSINIAWFCACGWLSLCGCVFGGGSTTAARVPSIVYRADYPL